MISHWFNSKICVSSNHPYYLPIWQDCKSEWNEMNEIIWLASMIYMVLSVYGSIVQDQIKHDTTGMSVRWFVFKRVAKKKSASLAERRSQCWYAGGLPECCSEWELWQWFGDFVWQGSDSSAIWGWITVSITRFSLTFDSTSLLIAVCWNY